VDEARLKVGYNTETPVELRGGSSRAVVEANDLSSAWGSVRDFREAIRTQLVSFCEGRATVRRERIISTILE